MKLFKQNILNLNFRHYCLKLILILVLTGIFLPTKANAKSNNFKEKEGEIVEKVKQIETKGDTILGAAKHLGVHGTTFDHVVQAFNGLKTYIDKYTNKFENSWSSIEGLKGKINNSIGVLKIPDPLQAADEILKAVLKQKIESNGIDPGIKGENASKEFHRAYTYGQSGSVLGKGGQKAQLEESQNTQLAVDTSSSQANDAQSDVVTQDILKKIAVQNLQAQKIQKSLQDEEQKQTRLAATTAMNLADISEGLDKQTRKEQLEKQNYRREILGTATFNNTFWEKKK